MILYVYIIMKDMKYRIAGILAIVVVLILCVSVYVEYHVSNETQEPDPSAQINRLESEQSGIVSVSSIESVQIRDTVFVVEVVDTEEKRTLGLSGRESLLPVHGMLFVFEELGHYSFWMKDMNFAIDIIWVDEHRKIVFIMEHVMPETYPEVYVSEQKALYVLELASGVVEVSGMDVGDELIFLE